MDSPPKLAGETLIVHHIPLVHCQVPDRQCCGGGKRANPFCQPELGAPRATSLPERGLAQADSLLYSSLAEAAEDAGSQARDSAALGVTGRHNPFLLSESEGHDLRSFHLHGSMVTGNPAFQLHDLPPFHLHAAGHAGPPWSVASRSGVVDGQEDRLPSADARKRSDGGSCPLASEGMELDECGCQHGSFFEGGEADWNNSSDGSGRHPDAPHSRTCSCSSTEQRPCRFSSTSSQSEGGDQPMGYVSDSSCNSSDGVLVNFSALYNKMHGHSRSNLNSASLSCDSSFCSHSDTGAFYLDLHPSPPDPPRPATACGCHGPASPGLDANCNSYHLHSEPCPAESADLTACFQSQARLVVATQNYYKLVTCDLSSQSSPSPAGSSITSCSEEHAKGSPVQPAEYYLFRRPEAKPEESDGECFLAEPQGTAAKTAIEGQVYVNVSPPTLGAGRPRSRSYDRNLGRTPAAGLGALERMLSCPVKLSESPALAIPSSPPRRVTSFAELAKGRRKTGASPPLRASGDSSLEFSPIPEFQQDCPGLLEDPARRCHSLPPMPFGHCLNRSCQGYRVENRLQESPGACSGRDSGARGHGAAEQAPVALLLEAGVSPANGHGPRDVRARADGGSADSQAVVRYSKEQRPTSLPIQPFVFQHHFSRPPKARALHGHLAASLSQLYSAAAARQPAPAAAASAGQPGALLAQRSADGAASLADGDGKKPGPDGTRPSPLGSYSPVRSSAPFFQSLDSGSPTPERAGESLPPRSQSCPLSANLLPARASPSAPPRQESPRPVPAKEAPLEQSTQVSEYRLHGDSLPPLALGGAGVSRGGVLAEPQWRGSSEAGGSGALNSAGARPLNANHLSPQALKWREYRRRNPLGLERGSGAAGLAGSLDRRQEPQPARRNPSLEFPAALSTGPAHGRLNGQPARQLQLGYADLFPEYFSLAEKPPAEFCLSPDGSTESISVDLQQKKGLVKAINTAVDLIVAHFGTSRDPGVKAKLGNSSVSPNVGHLVLKYLCPAVRDVLSDGLKPHVLDLIVGQRRNSPWSVVEASTQLGPSTKVLHALRCKISQLAELGSPSMRLNAFVFGLLNVRALEFWVSHLHSHEDVVLAHYQPVGFLCLAHGLCQALFEELLLLLQPLSLLPFRLDLLFEHRLLQMGQQQRQRKELLRVRQDMLLSAHSTLQLMRSRGGTEPPDGAGEPAAGQEPRRAKEGAGQEPQRAKEGAGKEPRRAKEGAWQEPRRVKEGAGLEPRRAKEGAWQEPRRAKEGAGLEPRRAKEGAGQEPQRAKEGAGKEPRRAKEGAGEERRDRQAGWWYQLMQSSQVYIEGSAAGSKFSRPEKKKKAVPRPDEGGTAPPPREGVVEGAEACPMAEGVVEERPKGMAELGQASDRGWPSWMGSPPDSVLAELKHSKEKEHGAPQGEGLALPPAEDSSSGAPDSSQPIKWGCLFGARKAPKEARQPNRLPSGWLTLDRSVFQLVAQTVGAGMWREPAPEPGLPPQAPEEQLAGGLPPQAPCAVKALCHHIATEAGQLSFTKGAVLRVLARADGDWLRCGLGSQSGLVPVAYVTHLADEDY